MARRLRRLFDAGLLDVRTERLSQKGIYLLGPAGRRWAEVRGLTSGRLPKPPWDHHLAIVRVWSEMARLAHMTPDWRLEAFRPDWELRGLGAALAQPLIPDAVADVSVPLAAGGTIIVRVAVEVDLGGEATRVLRAKLGAYRDELAFGDGFLGAEFCLAVVVGGAGAGRLETVRRLLEEHWPGPWAVWSLDDGPAEVFQGLIDAAISLPFVPPLTARGGEVA
jgi:hypothetical protein